MPFLSCSAVKCIYNDDHYCQKGDILVEGNHAQEPSETCCSSFREDNGEMTAKNFAGESSGKILVDCTACNCRYNRGEKCYAEKIAIAGSSACQCRQTECSTFDKE